MGRPRKTNADYFPHDAQGRNKPRVRALIARLGTLGYAAWNMTREMIAHSEGFIAVVEPVDVEVEAATIAADPQEVLRAWKAMSELGLIEMNTSEDKPGFSLECPELVRSLKPLLSERKRKRLRSVKPGTNADMDRNNPVSDGTNPRINKKVKEIKEREKEKEKEKGNGRGTSAEIPDGMQYGTHRRCRNRGSTPGNVDPPLCYR